MQAAITTLEIALETLANNEPINRREGNIEQADLEAKNAAEIREALGLLREHSKSVKAKFNLVAGLFSLVAGFLPPFDLLNVLCLLGALLNLAVFISENRDLFKTKS